MRLVRDIWIYHYKYDRGIVVIRCKDLDQPKGVLKAYIIAIVLLEVLVIRIVTLRYRR